MAHHALSRRALIALTAAGAALPHRGRAAAADPVTVQLDWIVRGTHAPFFVAKAKGYFAAEDIDLTTIRRGTGSGNTLQLVGNGGAEFGFADLPTLLVSRSNNVPAVAIAPVTQKSTLAFISLAKTKELHKPEDLRGAHIGVSPSGSTQVFLKAFLAANKMTLADVQQSTVPAPYENFLLLGRVEVIPGYTDAEVPELAEKAGGTSALSIMLGADYGYTPYGSGLFTSERMIAEKPGLVKRFTKAFLRGFGDTVQNPKEAAGLIVAANPEFKGKEEIMLASIEADMAGPFFSDATKANGLGWNTAASWDATAKILIDQGLIPAQLDVAKAYDNSFAAAGAGLHA